MTALWEIFLQIAGEILTESGFRSLGEPFRRQTRAHPLMAGAGVMLLGGIAGAIASIVWPARILQPGPVPGASLLVSPLITGAVIDRYGRWKEDRGRVRSYLATFWGGALFAFGMALVRFVWVAT